VINGANTGFMLLAASLVMLMTPGLAFFSRAPLDHDPERRGDGNHDLLRWFAGYSLCFPAGATASTKTSISPCSGTSASARSLALRAFRSSC